MKMAHTNSRPITAKLSALWRDPDVETLEIVGRRYALISDAHLGNGGRADDFRRNERVLVDALRHYAAEGYTLILLGDVEEFWQFDLPDIVRRYDHTVYAALRAFGDARVLRVFGNHDCEWGGLADPARQTGIRVSHAAEAIRLADATGQPRFLLVHGHQGSADADKYAWMSRFFVRWFKLIEPAAKRLGLYGDRSATKSQIMKDYERTVYAWAKTYRVIAICGHTHRAIFASKSYAEKLQEQITALRATNAAGGASEAAARANVDEIIRLRAELRVEQKRGRVIVPVERKGEPLPCYFNTGCATYTDGVTAIELCHPEIRLVKWNRSAPGPTARTVYGPPGNVDEMVARVLRSFLPQN
jgi:UDP-2,3-diacylglucosamine pyrophosphatase LpxH